MRNEIIKACKVGSVSFAELSRKVDGFSGSVSLGFGKNICLWFGLSQDAADIMGDLIKSEVIEAKATSPIIYMIDGMIPSFPVAKQNREYKTPRWAPVVFNVKGG